ncbi:hypothetical protein [Psychroserpens damuponensis]|uniref:hypothetical protein n=1 Tax=Psychroserpens damuponensis TaxID=943936 RepID=UPI00058D108B|nr:hypothetical protein [Psychroserpens damuponensis]
MKKQMHLAAQYLAAAGISFLEKKDDDSHTNLGFNIKDALLETHVLSNNGDQLCLNYNTFSLQWKSGEGFITSFLLDGKTHKEVLTWLKDTSKKHLNKAYNYHLHYDLPYTIHDDFVFLLKTTSQLDALVHLRTMAQLSLEQINLDFKTNASIRVWPHHFDTGIYTTLVDQTISFGLGLAIPDDLSEVHYLYISAYKDGQAVTTSGFSPLQKGRWINNNFKGAILPATGVTKQDAIIFFKAAINHYNQ